MISKMNPANSCLPKIDPFQKLVWNSLINKKKVHFSLANFTFKNSCVVRLYSFHGLPIEGALINHVMELFWYFEKHIIWPMKYKWKNWHLISYFNIEENDMKSLNVCYEQKKTKNHFKIF